jgi:hypothetical protein
VQITEVKNYENNTATSGKLIIAICGSYIHVYISCTSRTAAAAATITIITMTIKRRVGCSLIQHSFHHTNSQQQMR